MNRAGLLLGLLVALGILTALALPLLQSGAENVVVYTALDREFSEPVFEEFTRQTGVRVLAKYDTESTKTVGLTQALFAERDRPRCDLFWNNEIVNTLRLDQAELLASYDSEAAEDYPEQYRSSGGTWHGFAARARILVVNTELVAAGEEPTSIMDLTDPQVARSRRLCEAACRDDGESCGLSVCGLGRATRAGFFSRAESQCQGDGGQQAGCLGGCPRRVGIWPHRYRRCDGRDRKRHARENRLPRPTARAARHVVHSQHLGTDQRLAQSSAGATLVEFLLSPEVERMLAFGPSAQIPLNPEVEGSDRVESPKNGARDGC